MFHKISDFIEVWQDEGKSTERLFQLIPDSVLHEAPVKGSRSLGRLVWHIIETPKEMLERTGLKVDGPEWGKMPPASMKEVIDLHNQVVEATAKAIKENWTDELLEEVDDMYGMAWKRGHTLMTLLGHLIHHRGQLSIYMRLLDLQVTGMYGPAKEEWEKFGMPLPEEEGVL